ncbi:MAG: beta-glucosidase [Clostridia bacterium]|nr:beta-glucosidase [Clostridia bacterium]
MAFKKDFVWGTATASYQIEGAITEGGKTLSVWDRFAHEKGTIIDGQNGDVACDFYHRYEEDILLMKKLGVNAYRFSLSMTRLLNEDGSVNLNGVDFYNKVINLCISYKITPYVTLYHWDLPVYVQDKGGFLNRELITAFFDNYAKVVAEHFGDRVKTFITFNEPFSFISNGHVYARHAPGLKLGRADTLKVIHNMLLCHGVIVKVLREKVKGAKIGISTSSWIACPTSDGKEDIEVARNTYFGLDDASPSENVSIYTDPIYLGDYPKEYYEKFKDILPEIKEGDMELISQKTDFLGHNIYTGYKVGASGKVETLPCKIGNAVTDIGWEFMPESIYWGVKFLYERYNLPVFITENGVSMTEVVNSSGKVRDTARIDYVSAYLSALKKATDDGVDVGGYFYWSFCDNFEWACGYRARFGLIHVDYETQKRTPKNSYYWFKKVVKSNGKRL